MVRSQHILLPANQVFIVFSLLVAFIFDLLPWGMMVGVPDFVALVLVFWNIHQPRKVGIGVAFLMGLLVDVHHGSLLGENALAYTLLSYFAITIHRRVLWFSSWVQALHVLLLVLFAQLVQMAVRLSIGSGDVTWYFLLEVGVSALLWPSLSWLLLAPQRRAVDRDDTRPL